MKRKIIIITIALGVAFIGWRLVRPMQIYVVSPAFERPMTTSKAPVMFPTLSAAECATSSSAVTEKYAHLSTQSVMAASDTISEQLFKAASGDNQ